MSIVLINPNSTASMTAAMLHGARLAAPDLVFDGWTSHGGPPAIQGAADGALAVPPLLELVREASNMGASGIIIGCFDDTGLDEAREIAACPVIGIGQAGYHMATLLAGRFSVVTTLGVSVPVLRANIDAQGFAPHLGRVRASEVPVLALEADPDAAHTAILRETRAAMAEDDVRCVVLGCAGMVDLPVRLSAETGATVIDGVTAAARLMAALAGLHTAPAAQLLPQV
ncbi:HyuE hydantoin racemase [Meridianimarinicoccus roseus]|uniref:HyuE hydantoin racemase n=1 Tax=Meridianimarinicoccus roseus TaxID=2072018 RepID=A0A2V2LK57_9RHOB|nr:aspartate/glutamate racemase family protein [Meridianimarinicoccus roseus]PWR03596.1 HyuE hydantoin racemase [Meridianimarinicoccus roseus]